jgi:hypothetical protein
MNRALVVFALVAAVAIGFAVATVISPADSAIAQPEDRVLGRYVIVTNNSNAAYTFLLDTEVGLIWTPKREGDGVFYWTVSPREPVH